MSYRVTRIGADVVLAPERAALALLRLFERYGGNTGAVARCLGVSRSTVKRWLRALDAGGCPLRSQVASIRTDARDDREGCHA
jgi:transposase